MRLRLFHTPDGTRIAYREHGTGRPLIVVHSGGLSHREFEPLCGELGDRYRLVLPDLPGHGDSESSPPSARRRYDYDWLASTIAAFCHDRGGTAPLVGGHGLGADLLLRAIALGELRPGRLVLMPCRMHRPPGPVAREQLRRARIAARLGPIAGTAAAAVIPRVARIDSRRLTVSDQPAASALLRHATIDLATDRDRVAAWSRVAEAGAAAHGEVLDLLPKIACPTLLLWADADPDHPLRAAEEAIDLLPDGLLRVLQGAGYLIAYDDPVAVSRELASFLS
ncbi:MAG: alpha/beta hydrolase [Baekduia sp.]